MARKGRDPLEHAIEAALAPGAFVGYGDNWSFVEDLEVVRVGIAALIKEGEPERAVALLETFLAGCYEKSEQIDDSSGNFGMFVEGLFCGWIEARQAAKSDPGETAELLLTWMEDDEYGYCHGLEKKAVKVLDRAGLAAFERAVRGRGSELGKDSYVHRRQVEILKAIYEERRDVEAYVALCEAEGNLAPRDCEVLAGMFLKRRRPGDALTWAERGLELERQGPWPNRSSWRLPGLRREILKKLGRGAEALASAWGDYHRAPSVYSYEELMKYVARAERDGWHGKAMAALDGADLSSRIDLLVRTKEGERLAEVVEAAADEDLMALSHCTTEPAAKKLVRPYPLLAAKLHVAMALRILEARKSKYYDVALGNLEKARKLLLKEGRAEEWEELAGEIREKHRRKGGFMPGFERLVEGRWTREPSFLDRARRKWNSKTG